MLGSCPRPPRALLGWTPSGPTPIDDLDSSWQGHSGLSRVTGSAAVQSPRGRGYHGTVASRSVKVPVGPSRSTMASATMASVPSVTVCVPVFPFRSVAV